MLEKNKVYSAVIDGYSAEGLGVARIDGQVVFVHGGVRGEACDVLVMKVLKNAAYGKVVAVHAPSPRRVEPDCPYYGKCGGCDFRHLDYAEELWAKRQRVQDTLRRLGGSDAAVEEILGASSVRRYRNKAQYEISPAGEVGFFRARSHQVVDVEQCLLQSAAADAAAQALRAYIRQYNVSCYDEKTGKGLLRHLLVRNNCKGEILVCIFANAAALPHEEKLTELLRRAVPDTVGVVLGVHREKGNAVLGESYRTLWGADTLEDTLCDLTFHLSVPSFYQVHHEQAQRLYEKALEFAALTGRETVLDLYCGTGTITQVLAQHAKEAVGAEIVPAAVENARASARRNGVENVRFFCGDAAAVAADFAARGVKPDVVCVDPPRKGLAPEVIESVASMAPQRVVYVSCDVATLGRDVKRFSAYGYTVQRAVAVDMFPRTRHVETVVLLGRGKNAHFMKLNSEPFEMIKNGQKTIELRLFDEKRQKIKSGDEIVFTNTMDGRTLKVIVSSVHRFDNFEELYKSLPLLQCGYTKESVKTASPSDMESYYSAEEQKKYGVVGIEIFRPNQTTDETVVLMTKK